jgi:hypothetical protein
LTLLFAGGTVTVTWTLCLRLISIISTFFVFLLQVSHRGDYFVIIVVTGDDDDDDDGDDDEEEDDEGDDDGDDDDDKPCVSHRA